MSTLETLVSFLRKEMSSDFFPCLWWKLAKNEKYSKNYPPKKATYLLIPVFSCKKVSLHHLETLKTPAVFLSCVKVWHKINQSLAWNFASQTSLNIKSKNTFKDFPQYNSFSNLKPLPNAGKLQWPTRSLFNIITAAKQNFTKRVKRFEFWIFEP